MRGIISDLRKVVDLTEINHPEKEDKIISEGTEECMYLFPRLELSPTNLHSVLKLETLLKLSESTSYELRSAYEYLSFALHIIVTNGNRALRIISQRSTKGEARTLLLDDLASLSKKRQGKALTALHFLVTNRARTQTSPPTDKSSMLTDSV